MAEIGQIKTKLMELLKQFNTGNDSGTNGTNIPSTEEIMAAVHQLGNSNVNIEDIDLDALKKLYGDTNNRELLNLIKEAERESTFIDYDTTYLRETNNNNQRENTDELVLKNRPTDTVGEDGGDDTPPTPTDTLGEEGGSTGADKPGIINDKEKPPVEEPPGQITDKPPIQKEYRDTPPEDITQAGEEEGQYTNIPPELRELLDKLKDNPPKYTTLAVGEEGGDSNIPPELRENFLTNSKITLQSIQLWRSAKKAAIATSLQSFRN